jgi:hypothetical protein
MSSDGRIGHFHVASVKAQLSHTRGDAGLRPFFKDLDRRNEMKGYLGVRRLSSSTNSPRMAVAGFYR